MKIPQALIKREMEFPGVFKKRSCGIFMGLGFSCWNIQGVSHNFAEFPARGENFLQNFVVTNLKIPGGFSEKYILNTLHPVFFFFFLE